jgi:uncharacterized protein YjbJ (UPF0337 family)
MSEPREEELEEQEAGGVRGVISGFGQKVIGAVEEVGGILTADPNTAAEGEFNIEVGDAREDAEEALEKGPRRVVDEATRDAER